GRSVGCELFEVEDIEKARRRFEELRPNAASVPENAACRLDVQLGQAAASKDWQALRALVAPDFVFEDRRKYARVKGDVEVLIKNLQFVLELQFSHRSLDLAATVGERIALTLIRYTAASDGGTLDGEFLRLTEVDAQARLRALIHFDCEDRHAAFEEGLNRFAHGEAAGGAAVALIRKFGAAINGHRWDELADFLADGLLVRDHRKLSFGEMPRDTFIESLRVLSDLGPDVGGEQLRVLAWNDHGSVFVLHQFGTARDGGSFESLFIPVLVVRGNHIVAYEIFDVADSAQALARFDALCAAWA
ncbi:MAG TPA: hypothetical protein VMT89_05125, partial [Candidatus Acidoferrales bacterium]|nr:hypothetical protein [Candidatus Acidoferrales bacterium]